MEKDRKERAGVSDAAEKMRERRREYGFNYESTEDGLYSGITRDDISAGMLVLEGAPAYNVRSESPEGYDRNLRIAGKRQGEFTIEDRNSIPEDRPSELIDGVIYNMASPTHRHQTAAGAIYYQLCRYVDSRGGNCMPFIAPADVRLDRDDDTMLVPDVFVVCESDEPKLSDEGYIDGAPDLVIEVLSPSTRKKDMFIKLEKYRNAGVREYWIVDLQKEKVIVYLFGEEPDIGLYGFDSRIPVGIYGGDCQIDFTEVVRNLKMAERLGRGTKKNDTF
ncbi:MAG: Uma2 family endonuclease [Lachnospiraceae bacterium]|nr:Uma2 family endonuclease [Lachnospiraceae bacterium]